MRRILPRHIGSAVCRRQPAFPWAAPWSRGGIVYPALPPAVQLCELVVVSRPYVYRRSATLRAVHVPCQSICYRSRGESLISCCTRNTHTGSGKGRKVCGSCIFILTKQGQARR